MTTRALGASLPLLLAAATAVGASAAQSANMGTWKLNDGKSTFPAGATKDTTVTYAAAPGGMIRITADGVDGAGKAVHTEWTGHFDGRDYPVVGGSAYDTRAYRLAGKSSLAVTVRKAGRVVATGKIELGPDGKSRTVAMTSSVPELATTSVYDKQ